MTISVKEWDLVKMAKSYPLTLWVNGDKIENLADFRFTCRGECSFSFHAETSTNITAGEVIELRAAPQMLVMDVLVERVEYNHINQYDNCTISVDCIQLEEK